MINEIPVEYLDDEFRIFNGEKIFSRRESSIDWIQDGKVAVKCSGIKHKITGEELCKMVNHPQFMVLKPKSPRRMK